MIHGDEHGDLAVAAGMGSGGVGSPHHIGRHGGDGGVMGAGPVGVARPLGGQQDGGSHEPEDAGLSGRDALKAQARPDLAIPLAGERGADDDPSYVFGERGIGVERLRPAPLGKRRRGPRRPPLGLIEGRALELPAPQSAAGKRPPAGRRRSKYRDDDAFSNAKA